MRIDTPLTALAPISVAAVGEPSVDSDWVEITRLLNGSDFTALTLAVADLPTERRRAVAAALRRYVQPGEFDATRRLNEPGIAIVGAGVLQDAKSVAAWLTRHSMHDTRPGDPSGWGRYVEITVVPNVLYVLAERGVPWLAELANRIASGLPRQAEYGRDRFELTCRLLEATAMPVPTTPGFVAGWVRRLQPETVIDELSAHPEFVVLAPLIFDVEEAGAWLSHDRRWPNAFADAVKRGLVDRKAVLDACVARLARSGRPGATRAYLAMLDAFAPSDEEVGERREAYLAMLESSESTVATAAQTRLFDLDDRGTLSTGDRLSLTRAMLGRREKKLVRAQLARIAKAAPDDPDERAQLAQLIASSWAGKDADIVRHGIRTLAALRLPATVRNAVVELAAQLPADLVADLRAGLGAETSAGPSREASESAPAPAPERIPLAPITNLGTLVAETIVILEGHAADLTTAQLETVIDGLLTAAATHPDALRNAVGPVLTAQFAWLREYREFNYSRTLRHAVWALAMATVGEAPVVHPWEDPDAKQGLEAVLVDRILALAIESPLPPQSVALPSWTNGLIDPDALLTRLALAAADRWRPPARELEQALLRLDVPHTVQQRVALSQALGGVGTAAGSVAAEWVTAQRPEHPAIERVIRTQQHAHWDNEVVSQTSFVEAKVRGNGSAEPEDGIWAGLTAQQPASYPPYESSRSPRCWPAVAPRHREVIAAHCIRCLDGEMDASSRITEVLPELAEIEGPIGEATALALAYGLCAGRTEQRRVAQRGLRLMCARPEWEGATFGRVLGELFERRSVVMKRAVEALRQVADPATAAALWPAVREAVERLLTSPDPPPALGDLLALAAELAQQNPATTHLPGLTEFAARPGRSRQLVEARRLLAVLSR